MLSETDVRRLALALPAAVELAHHGSASFRVDGRIFATLPGTERLRVMLDEAGIRSAATAWPGVCQEFYWGKRLACIEVDLSAAEESLVRELLTDAWEGKRRPDR